MDSFQRVLPFLPALLFPVPLGERHLLPSCPRHTGYCGLRRTLQLLGQRRPHKVKDLRAAGPANHSVLLQSQRQHLCLRLQLRLVKGGGVWACLPQLLPHVSFSFFLSKSDFLRAMSTTTPRKRTTSSWGMLLRSWSHETRNGERRANAICRGGSCILEMGLPFFLSAPLTINGVFKGTHWSWHVWMSTVRTNVQICSLLHTTVFQYDCVLLLRSLLWLVAFESVN